jgi:N6-adenosine-specific RNA methylase IME4
LTGPEAESLAADIAANGLQEPIWTFQGRIVDGRNRFAACITAGVEPVYREWPGQEEGLLAFILSENLHRRHLNESQRAMVVDKINSLVERDKSEIARVAAAERWAQDREIKEISEDKSFSYDQRYERIASLKENWNREYRKNTHREARQIYIAASENKIKVGVSSDPEGRMVLLRCANPGINIIKTYIGGFNEEKRIHEALKDYHLDREWFSYSEEVMEIIDDIMRTANLPPASYSNTLPKIFNVSDRTIRDARLVRQTGTSRLIAQVEQGNASVCVAKKITGQPEAVQEKACELIDQGEKPMNALRLAKREHMNENPVIPEGKFRIFYADPPWKYNDSGVIGNDEYARAESHYPCMSIETLCEMGDRIKEISEENAVLFLWVTSPLLEECFPVIKAWGFKYKASFVWDKIGANMGHYNSPRHEFLLVCTKGSCTPDVDTKLDSVQSIQRTGRHSEKPEEFRKIIETLYTHGNKIELFARKKSPEWNSWGNEA